MQIYAAFAFFGSFVYIMSGAISSQNSVWRSVRIFPRFCRFNVFDTQYFLESMLISLIFIVYANRWRTSLVSIDAPTHNHFWGAISGAVRIFWYFVKSRDFFCNIFWWSYSDYECSLFLQGLYPYIWRYVPGATGCDRVRPGVIGCDRVLLLGTPGEQVYFPVRNRRGNALQF